MTEPKPTYRKVISVKFPKKACGNFSRLYEAHYQGLRKSGFIPAACRRVVHSHASRFTPGWKRMLEGQATHGQPGSARESGSNFDLPLGNAGLAKRSLDVTIDRIERRKLGHLGRKADLPELSVARFLGAKLHADLRQRQSPEL